MPDAARSAPRACTDERALSELLPSILLVSLERSFAQPLGDVQLCVSPLPAQLGADAFAFGETVFVDPAVCDDAGLPPIGLLAHELTHVIQQRQGRAGSSGGHLVLGDDELEAEAVGVARLIESSWNASPNLPRRFPGLASPVAVGGSRAVIQCYVPPGAAAAAAAGGPLPIWSIGPGYVGNDTFGGGKRSSEAGKVTCLVETLHHAGGVWHRTVEVYGFVDPQGTQARGKTPESLGPMKISSSASEPARSGERDTGMVDVDKGHVMALELGGPNVGANIVPQWAKEQESGSWRAAERAILKDAILVTAKKLQKGQRLLFHAIVHYYGGTAAGVPNADRFAVPIGFTVTTTLFSGDNAVGMPVVRFRGEQVQNATDDMMELRQDPTLRAEPDLYSDTRTVGGKLKYGKGGPAAPYVPKAPPKYPPVTFSSSPANSGVSGRITQTRLNVSAAAAAAAAAPVRTGGMKRSRSWSSSDSDDSSFSSPPSSPSRSLGSSWDSDDSSI